MTDEPNNHLLVIDNNSDSNQKEIEATAEDENVVAQRRNEARIRLQGNDANAKAYRQLIVDAAVWCEEHVNANAQQQEDKIPCPITEGYYEKAFAYEEVIADATLADDFDSWDFWALQPTELRQWRYYIVRYLLGKTQESIENRANEERRTRKERETALALKWAMQDPALLRRMWYIFVKYSVEYPQELIKAEKVFPKEIREVLQSIIQPSVDSAAIWLQGANSEENRELIVEAAVALEDYIRAETQHSKHIFPWLSQECSRNEAFKDIVAAMLAQGLDIVNCWPAQKSAKLGRWRFLVVNFLLKLSRGVIEDVAKEARQIREIVGGADFEPTVGTAPRLNTSPLLEDLIMRFLIDTPQTVREILAEKEKCFAEQLAIRLPEEWYQNNKMNVPLLKQVNEALDAASAEVATMKRFVVACDAKGEVVVFAAPESVLRDADYALPPDASPQHHEILQELRNDYQEFCKKIELTGKSTTPPILSSRLPFAYKLYRRKKNEVVEQEPDSDESELSERSESRKGDGTDTDSDGIEAGSEDGGETDNEPAESVEEFANQPDEENEELNEELNDMKLAD